MRAAGRAVALAAFFGGAAAWGQAAGGGGATDAGAPERVWASCTEHIPKGASRPALDASFPDRGTSGYEARLEVVVSHGGGESVLPEAVRVQRGSDAERAVKAAGFEIPHEDGGSPFALSVEKSASGTKTRLSIPFVPLPREPGRHLMVLPPVPVMVARASGEVMTLCTEAHRIVVEDPIANETDPPVKLNPPPRPQREEWTLAKQIFYGALAALGAGALFGWLLHRWSKRPKPVLPVPKVLPWIAALAELAEIRRSGLLDVGQNDVFCDRTSDCLRKYLGERYGFDGLESTTAEIRDKLRRIEPPIESRKSIGEILEESDLVKFARLVPTREECGRLIGRAETIVHETTPPARPAAASAAPAAGAAPPGRAA
ncbi:MAG: hypothetical protein HY744_04500 [Deltaproteobacteria bacterium]|nr:hypothetical protein [Deltaproteobacteria bacterium]